MIFSLILLILTSTAIDATFDDLPDFMPNFMEMVPLNGQLRFNDQVFSFGDPNETPASADSNEGVPEEVSPGAPQPQAQPLPPVANSLPQNTNTFESRAPNSQPLAFPANSLPLAQNPVPNPPQTNDPVLSSVNSANVESRTPTFESRIPESVLRAPVDNLEAPNARSADQTNAQTPNPTSVPNIGSLEVGSTFARNANSDFRDEFSAPTPAPFGMPIPFGQELTPSPSLNERSNANPTESPLVVMPLVVSPNRLLQADSPMTGQQSAPVPVPSLMPSSVNANERSSFGSRQSMPFPDSRFNGPITLRMGPKPTNQEDRNHDSVHVSRQSSFILPEPTVNKLSESSVRSTELEQHLPPVVPVVEQPKNTIPIVSGPTERMQKSLIPFHLEPVSTPPLRIPTLAELDQQMEAKRSEEFDDFFRSSSSSSTSTEATN